MPAVRSGQVIVITGASSGIGRATALRFAARQTRLVLVSRHAKDLEQVAEPCRALGAECLIMEADVVDADAIQAVGDAALKKWGQLDVWINNAGVATFGSFTDVPLAEHRRVFETDLLGYINGAYTALTIFKEQNHGVLINNASVVCRLATPHLSTYIAAKFGVRGLTHALRQDLSLERRRDIHVCQINPGVVDTPAFENAGNHSGHTAPMQAPASTPEAVAKKIMRLVEHPKREVFVGFLPWLGSLGYTLFPGFTALVLVWGTRLTYASTAKSKGQSSGHLF